MLRNEKTNPFAAEFHVYYLQQQLMSAKLHEEFILFRNAFCIQRHWGDDHDKCQWWVTISGSLPITYCLNYRQIRVFLCWIMKANREYQQSMPMKGMRREILNTAKLWRISNERGASVYWLYWISSACSIKQAMRNLRKLDVIRVYWNR